MDMAELCPSSGAPPLADCLGLNAQGTSASGAGPTHPSCVVGGLGCGYFQPVPFGGERREEEGDTTIFGQRLKYRGTKRRHEIDDDDEESKCLGTAKRFLSEEAMSKSLQQLNLTTSTAPTASLCSALDPNTLSSSSSSSSSSFSSLLPMCRQQLNIQSVGSCPNSHQEEATGGRVSSQQYRECVLSPAGQYVDKATGEFGASPLSPLKCGQRHSSGYSSTKSTNLGESSGHSGVGTSSSSSSPTAPKSLSLSGGHSAGRNGRTCHKNVLSSRGVEVKVTPATPTSSSGSPVTPTRRIVSSGKNGTRASMVPSAAFSSSSSSSSSFYSPFSSSYCLPLRKNWDVILEDISSDSSDGMDNSERTPSVWLAPEIRNGLSGSQSSPLLPRLILDEVNKKGMELVPWVEPERVLLRAHPPLDEMKEDSTPEDSELESPESGDDRMWDYDEMES